MRYTGKPSTADRLPDGSAVYGGEGGVDGGSASRRAQAARYFRRKTCQIRGSSCPKRQKPMFVTPSFWYASPRRRLE